MGRARLPVRRWLTTAICLAALTAAAQTGCVKENDSTNPEMIAGQEPRPGGSEPPGPPSPARAGGAGAAGSSGTVWLGIVRFRHTWNDGGASGEQRSEARLRLTEGRQEFSADPRAPLGKPVMSLARLVHAGSTIEETLTATGCRGRGRARVSGEAGMLWRNLSGGDISGVAGFSVPPEGAYVMLQIHGSVGTAPQTYPVTCEPGGASGHFFFVAPFGQGVPYTPDARLADNGARIVGRAAWDDGDHRYELAWSVCREGVACPPPDEMRME